MQKVITHANFAKGFRGGERQTQLLIQELAEEGYRQTLLVRKNSELGERCKGIKNLTIEPIAKPYVFNVLHFRNSSIIHAHETKALQVAYWLHLLFNTPYIVTRRVDNAIKTNYLNTKMYTDAEKCVALSNVIEKEILRIAPHSDTAIIPSAFSDLPSDEKVVASLKKRFEGKFVIGNIGALDNAHKGQFYLIEAARKLEKSHPEIHFIFLGSGIDEANFKEQARGLANITFEGFVDNIGDYLSIFDLFVFPSLHEGLGSILFDVMRFNVPVIATDVGGIPDIIKHNKNGLLVNPKDSDAIYSAIISLKNYPETAKKLAAQALANVQNYSPKSMAQSYIKIYNESTK